MSIKIQTQKDYKILSRLGQGLSSDVYKCLRQDPGSNFQQIVTLKQYKSDGFRKKFHNELENLSRISSEGIPKVLDWSYEEDRLTIITEYVDGCDLHQFIQAMQSRQIEVSAGLKAYIVDGVFQSLKALHEAGICHGDLKPSNVLLSVDGSIKLIDICLSDHGFVYATPEFSAPEVLAGHRPDFRSDLYSLGLLAQALEIKDETSLLQIKPGLRKYKRPHNLKPSVALSELSALVWKVKYEFDSNEVTKQKINLHREAVDQVAANTVEYQFPLTQEVKKSKVSYKLLGVVRSGPAICLEYLKWIRLVLVTSVFLVVISSQAHQPLLSMSSVQFRSLKALEVWDQDRWNFLPYDIKTSIAEPTNLTFKFRTHKKVKTIKVPCKPYENRVVEIDAL